MGKYKIGSMELLARAVYELNNDLPDGLTAYPIPVAKQISYFMGYLDEIANAISDATAKANTPLCSLINLMPEAGKYKVTSEGIKFDGLSILIIIPAYKGWTSEEINYYAHLGVLRELVDKFIEKLKIFCTIDGEYSVFEGSSVANIGAEQEVKSILSKFGDYLGYIYIEDLSLFVPNSICEETFQKYIEIFKKVNKPLN